MKDYFKFISQILLMFTWFIVSGFPALYYLAAFLNNESVSFVYTLFGFLFGILTLPGLLVLLNKIE